MVAQIVAFVAMLLAAVIFQTFFVGFISILGVSPDIFIILVVFVTLTKGLTWGALFGFISGLVEGSADPNLFGLSALLKLLLALSLFLIAHRFRLESPLVRVLAVVVAVIIHNLLYYLAALQLDSTLIAKSTIRYAIPDALYSALVAVIIMYLAERQLTLKFEA